MRESSFFKDLDTINFSLGKQGFLKFQNYKINVCMKLLHLEKEHRRLVNLRIAEVKGRPWLKYKLKLSLLFTFLLPLNCPNHQRDRNAEIESLGGSN